MKVFQATSIWAGLSILLQQFVQFVNNVADCCCWTVYVLLPCFDERRTWLGFHFWTNGFNFKGLSVSNGCSEMKVRSSVRRWSARTFFPVWSRCLQIFWKSHPIFSQSTPNASTSTLVWSLGFLQFWHFELKVRFFANYFQISNCWRCAWRYWPRFLWNLSILQNNHALSVSCVCFHFFLSRMYRILRAKMCRGCQKDQNVALFYLDAKTQMERTFNVKTQMKGENWQAVQTQKVFWCSLPKVLQWYLTSTPLFLIQNFKCRFSAQLIYDELTVCLHGNGST